MNVVHHIELWTTDLDASAASIGWLLTSMGWSDTSDPAWPAGRTWEHASGVYVVLEASPAVAGPHNRMRAGLNHLALRIPDSAELDRLRLACVDYGWTELFAERYPHAGGPDHVALFIQNAEGFEFELVAAPDIAE